MLITTKGKGIELLNRALPYPEQMKNIDLDKENAIYFDWRSKRYKLDLQFCRVERSNGCILEVDDSSILMTRCLKAQLGTIM
jgi:hypothetical protein